MIFEVYYTNEDCVGNQTLTLEIEADDLSSAWEIVDQNYSHLAVDFVAAKEDNFSYYGA